MITIPTLVLAVVGVVLLNYIYGLLRNYIDARKSGFTLLVCPVDPDNTLWRLFGVQLRPLLKNYLPFKVYKHIGPTIYGWEHTEGRIIQDHLGVSTFLMVGPRRCELWVGDPDIAQTVLGNVSDYKQLEMAKIVIGAYGPNLVSLEGPDWKRQRRLIAGMINEKISRRVWDETSAQARTMAAYLAGQGGNNMTVESLRLIAINVLSAASYGEMKPWTPSAQNVSITGTDEKASVVDQVEKLTYADAVWVIINNIEIATLLPTWITKLPFMSKRTKYAGLVSAEHSRLAKEMVEKQKNGEASNVGMSTNILQALTDALPTALGGKAEKQEDSISPEEIEGNMFIFTLAGFDTTANSLAFAFTRLAAQPEWQQWIIDEIDQVIARNEGNQNEYAKVYPSLLRCLAVLYETVRRHPAVGHMSRETGAHQVELRNGSDRYLVPPNSNVYVSTPALHLDPRHWGADVLDFRPNRWINLCEDGKETIVTPERGTFLGWASGPRICPGMKMSHVEFVSVMFFVFKEYRIEPVVERGETLQMAQKKLIELTNDSQPRATLQMNRPKEVRLIWRPR